MNKSLTEIQWGFFVKMFKMVLGGWDNLLSALIMFMAVEYLTRILVAILNKEIFREIIFRDLVKKVSVFFLVVIGNVIDNLVIQNGGTVRTAVIFFYLYEEGNTILENATMLGLPIPQKLKEILEQMKENKKEE